MARPSIAKRRIVSALHGRETQLDFAQLITAQRNSDRTCFSRTYASDVNDLYGHSPETLPVGWHVCEPARSGRCARAALMSRRVFSRAKAEHGHVNATKATSAAGSGRRLWIALLGHAIDHLDVDPVDEERRTTELLQRRIAAPGGLQRVGQRHSSTSIPSRRKKNVGELVQKLDLRRAAAGTRRHSRRARAAGPASRKRRRSGGASSSPGARSSQDADRHAGRKEPGPGKSVKSVARPRPEIRLQPVRQRRQHGVARTIGVNIAQRRRRRRTAGLAGTRPRGPRPEPRRRASTVP